MIFDKNNLSFMVPNVGKDKRDSGVTGTLHGAGLTDPVHLDAHDPTNYSTDAGYVGGDTPKPPTDGAIGGVTWCDENEDGKRQADEAILPGGCVKRKKIVNGQYEVVAENTTDAYGRYKFEELPMGTYVVAWCDEDLTFTMADEGDDCKDSDVVNMQPCYLLLKSRALGMDHSTWSRVGGIGAPPAANP